VTREQETVPDLERQEEGHPHMPRQEKPPRSQGRTFSREAQTD
jgi:hypothetical protein